MGLHLAFNGCDAVRKVDPMMCVYRLRMNRVGINMPFINLFS